MRTTFLAVILAALACPTLATDDATVSKKGDNLVEVTVTGQGMTKEEAVRDGQRKAVEQGSGTIISSHSETKDFVLIRDSVLARATGFVQSYDVISEKTSEDGIVTVKLKVVVSIKGVEDMWGVVTNLLKEMGRPKIMVFVNEKIGREHVEDSTVQTRIEKSLLDSGFLLVNREQLKEIDKKDLQAAVAEDSPNKVQAIAKRFGAQIFISGTANAAGGDAKVVSGVELFSYEAEANIKTYRSDTAQLISSIPGKPVRGVQRVARSAAKQALDGEAELIGAAVREDILKHWMEILQGRGEVQLHVDGVTFKQYTDLKKALKDVKGVSAVDGKFANQTVEISIQADCNAEQLAEKLSDKIKQLDITDVSQNVIKAKYKSDDK